MTAFSAASSADCPLASWSAPGAAPVTGWPPGEAEAALIALPSYCWLEAQQAAGAVAAVGKG